MRVNSPALLDPTRIEFPDPQLALTDPNGLLAIGGDLSTERLIAAYQHGIFPWYEQGQPILWWSPDPRAVLFLDELKISKSLAKVLAQKIFNTTVDKDFHTVICACAQPRAKQADTWITTDMIKAYHTLHQQGHAHSIEVWQDEQLVGGLYGVAVGKVFCGESMFSRRNNASKVALVALVDYLKQQNFKLIDCQIPSEHLQSLGARNIPREEYLKLLALCR